MNSSKKIICILIALIPAVLIIAYNFQTEISGMFNQKKEKIFEIPIEANSLRYSYGDFSSDELKEYINRKLYVPNYDAEIKITPYQNTIQKEDNLKFKISIKDRGILQLDKAYFYIYILNPEKKVYGCFPSCKYEYSKRIPVWTMTSNPYSLTAGENYRLDVPILPIYKNNTLFTFYRESLIEGKGNYRFEYGNTLYFSKDQSEFYYTFPKTEVGDWEIYVLVFNEGYKDRNGDYLSNLNEKQYLVNYAKNIIIVKGREEIIPKKTFDWKLFIVKIFVIFLAAAGAFTLVYSTLSKHYNKFYKFIEDTSNIKEYYVGLFIILIIFFILLFLMLKRIGTC